MSRTWPEFILGVVWTFIIIYLFMVAFEYLFWRVSLINPGTLIGIGVAGCVGVLGFALKHWNGTTGIAISLLGGCIGSGLYRFDDWPSSQQNRESERLMLAHVLRESGYLKAIDQKQN